jgi:hypothetical protein
MLGAINLDILETPKTFISMKKIIVSITIYFCLFISAYAQKPDNKFARQYIDKALIYLKNSDTANFINLWISDKKNVVSNAYIKAYLGGIKIFLDTALKQNLKIDHVEVEKIDTSEERTVYHCYTGLYRIKAWFKYDEHYYKGIGFNLDFINNKWLCRYIDESTLLRPNSSTPK